ncbi:MAG TPA: phytanoyl-CoA dioxygenase family protein [Acidimicrobiales bacterium]|nr:phytanoyl-CoA dioxygenase family protein [Acidimicrobiales bacterium]
MIDVAAFQRDGYVIAPQLFSADEVECFRAALARVEAGEYRTGRRPTLDLPIPPDPSALRKIDNAWWADPDLASLATDKRLGEIAAALLDTPTVRLWQDQLLDKPPTGVDTGNIGWHQDWDSWKTVASRDAFVTAWVALDDVDEVNGAMQVIPGSHAWGHVPGASNFLGTDVDAQLARLGGEPRHLCMRAGEASFHHVLTFHGSGPNKSKRPRRSLAVHLVAGDVTAIDEGEGWRHYNLGLLQSRGRGVGDAYADDELWPVVFRA